LAGGNSAGGCVLTMSNAATQRVPDADISLRGVSPVYELGDEKIHAPRNLTLDIRHGECVAIKGPSGSGKSSLANVIGGLDTPNEGQIVVVLTTAIGVLCVVFPARRTARLDPVESLRYE
jgi:ABC-type glutathione transport system ATPase component